MSYNPVVVALAKALSPHTSQHGPRAPIPVTGIATLMGVDPYTQSVTVTINGGSVQIPTVRYTHAYTPADPPVVGDRAVMHISGAGQVFLMCKHVDLGALPYAILP